MSRLKGPWNMVRVTALNSPFLLGFDEIERALDKVSKSAADGYPPLFRRWHAPHLDAQAWADVFEHAYDQFCARVDAVPDRAWARPSRWYRRPA